MKYEERDIEAAVQDRRLWRSLVAATRDAAIRRVYQELREGGATVSGAVGELAERFSLSEERIRSLVYQK